MAPRALLENQAGHNNTLQVPRENLSQKIRWEVIEEDTQCSLSFLHECACVSTPVHTHTQTHKSIFRVRKV